MSGGIGTASAVYGVTVEDEILDDISGEEFQADIDDIGACTWIEK